MRQLLSFAVGGVCALALLFGAMACSTTDTAKLEPPTFYDEARLGQARDLIGQGYDLLDSSNVEGAVAKFAEIEVLIPSGLVGPYHTACAYGRTGDTEAAFQALNTLLDNGYDSPDDIRYDTDFESLHDDPRFEQLLDRARANYESGTAALANGMPEYDTPVDTFATEADLNQWADEKNRTLRSHSRFWRTSGYIAARMDLSARKLAALKVLKADDPEFDYGLERVRIAAGLKSAYESNWGAVSDLVLHEADNYLGTPPGADGASEANYRAGYAVSLKFDAEDVGREEGYRTAEGYLSKVQEGTTYYGAAQALMLINQLQSPDADEASLAGQMKEMIERYEGDDAVFRILSTRFSNDAARFVWPIALGMPDLDDKTISLDDYEGKALLIDFWATWCPPCRAELPNLVEVYQKYHPQGFEIVSISLDYANSVDAEAYASWIDSAGMNWRHTYDGEGWATPAVKRYYVGSIPAPFLVGTDGSLVAWGEDLRGEELAKTVEEALGI